MKWISAIKTDIDAARTKQADIPVWKTFRHNVFGRKVGQCPFRENEANECGGKEGQTYQNGFEVYFARCDWAHYMNHVTTHRSHTAH